MCIYMDYVVRFKSSIVLLSMFIFKPTYLDWALVLLTVTYHVVVMCFGFRRHSTQNTYMLCTLFHTTTTLYGMSRLNTYLLYWYIKFNNWNHVFNVSHNRRHIRCIYNAFNWMNDFKTYRFTQMTKFLNELQQTMWIRNMRCYMLHWNLHVLNVLNKYILTIQIEIHIQIQDRIIFNSFSIHSMIQDILHIDVDFDDPFFIDRISFFLSNRHMPISGYSQVYACTYSLEL